MEPIVNPWLVYWISTIEKLGVAAQILMICGFIIGGIIMFFNDLDRSWRTTEEIKRYNKFAKWLLYSGVIGAIFTVFLPNKESMLTMLALQYITPDNISLVQDNVIDFVMRISEAVKGVK